mmetsp:Transcript_13534/g.26842  ORF Transcript_13534/g.26842 Transcript_13534/m.26842 type:complete len:245 (-) Transcript_13534:626-1360(-)
MPSKKGIQVSPRAAFREGPDSSLREREDTRAIPPSRAASPRPRIPSGVRPWIEILDTFGILLEFNATPRDPPAPSSGFPSLMDSSSSKGIPSSLETIASITASVPSFPNPSPASPFPTSTPRLRECSPLNRPASKAAARWKRADSGRRKSPNAKSRIFGRFPRQRDSVKAVTVFVNSCFGCGCAAFANAVSSSSPIHALPWSRSFRTGISRFRTIAFVSSWRPSSNSSFFSKPKWKSTSRTSQH